MPARRGVSICTLVVSGLLLIASDRSDARQGALSVEEARSIVMALVAAHGCSVATCAVEPVEDRYFPQFLFFDVYWPNPTGSPHIGMWAVEPKTADLFSALGCAEYRTRAVSRVQERLRKRLGLTAAEHKALKQRPPMCEIGKKLTIQRRY